MSKFWAERPRLKLIVYCLLWKSLLICVALASPGPGYDTSTTLIEGWPVSFQGEPHRPTRKPHPTSKFVRWDAIYFVQIALRGYVWEQEWAFAWGHTTLLRIVTFAFAPTKYDTSAVGIAATGIFIATCSHLISALVLYELGKIVLRFSHPAQNERIALIAAFLHLVSPAGIFLVAPYAEGSFSATNLLGFLLYAKSSSSESGLQEFSLLVLSGFSFGVATILRGNGLLSGIVLLYNAIDLVCRAFSSPSSMRHLGRLSSVLSAGTFMAFIAAVPQYIAYKEFCSPTLQRPWCKRWIPSIYAWVQSEYWDVGLFKYWTMSNLPLFLLAAPALSILLYSGTWAWRSDWKVESRKMDSKIAESERFSNPSSSEEHVPRDSLEMMKRIALPQIILAILALSTYHVQIITRLSSGYPIWYWWIARLIVEDRAIDFWRRRVKPSAWIVRWMILYGVIQCGLFASFLPPA